MAFYHPTFKQMVKEVNPDTKCFIYHNMELALEFLESQREVMYDGRKKDYFLQYRRDGLPINNGTIYNEPIQQGDQVSRELWLS